MYLKARYAAVSNRNVHWVALKHRLNTWTLASFYYIDIGTYCCVFIALLQKRIAVVWNSNIWGLFLKVNALSCLTPNPTLNLPDSVNKCKTDIKTYLLMQPSYFNFLVCRFERLCWTEITRGSNQSSSPPKYVSVLRELPKKLSLWKPIDTRLDMSDANVQKHPFSNLPAV